MVVFAKALVKPLARQHRVEFEALVAAEAVRKGYVQDYEPPTAFFAEALDHRLGKRRSTVPHAP